MHTGENNTRQPLMEGQLYKLEQGYLRIVELGERLIQYKLLQQPDSTAITQMMRIEALANFLAKSEAELVVQQVAVP